MTEDEAKTKACCGSVATAWATIATAYAGQGHAELIPEAPKCIASACMAWRSQTRWHSQPGTIGREVDKPDHVGYCGLAGAPQ